MAMEHAITLLDIVHVMQVPELTSCASELLTVVSVARLFWVCLQSAHLPVFQQKPAANAFGM